MNKAKVMISGESCSEPGWEMAMCCLW